MATAKFSSPEMRKPASSPRPKGRENAKDTLCRNVLIYGHCRYEDQGCAFNHDPNKTHSSQTESYTLFSSSHLTRSPYLVRYYSSHSVPGDVQRIQEGTSSSAYVTEENPGASPNTSPPEGIFAANGCLSWYPLLWLTLCAPLLKPPAIEIKPTNYSNIFSRQGAIASSPRQSALSFLDHEKGSNPAYRALAELNLFLPYRYFLTLQAMARNRARKTPNANRPTSRKTLNVDSPSFTPATLPVPNKTSAISSQAANAAPFTPRGLSSGTTTPNPQVEQPPASFNPAQIREFTPQIYDTSESIIPSDGSGSEPHVSYDPFQMPGVAQALPTTPQYNPYVDESANMASNGAAYFQTSNAFVAPTQPLQYHMYAPIGPHREDLLAYQKHAHDFFMPEALREDLQKKAEATLQVMPNSQLPTLDTYHTLVALDTSHRKSAAVFGYPSWVYKATAMKNGCMYCLRRLEGYRLTNERAIRSVKDWRRVNCGGVVSVVDAFTTRAFGDSSLIFVTNYHPLSKTLVEHHFTGTNRFGNRGSQTVPEPVLWNYIVQIASAMKAVHSANLAVRCMDPSKVIITDKGRIRLGACSVLDVVQFEAQRPLTELQQEDFIHFGKLILSIATNNLSVTATHNLAPLVDQLARNYSSEFRDTVVWLLTTAQAPATKTAGELLSGISNHIIDAFDSSLHANDTLHSELAREVENGRLARLLMKLGTINERLEYEGDVNWSETSERYILKLFRDFVFHQVNAEGRPVLDMGHMIACLNKLDAGSQEKVSLTSRDEQSVFVVTYNEIKKQVNAAWSELQKPTRR